MTASRDVAARGDGMRLVRLTGAAAVVLAAGLAAWLWPLRPGVLALQFAFTPRTFGTIVHLWTAEDLQRYRMHLPVDGLLLACYGAFGWLVATRTALFRSYGPAARRAAALLLPLAAAFDATENALHWWLTEVPRFGVAPLYVASAACSTVKWLLLLAFGAAVIHAAARDAADAPQ